MDIFTNQQKLEKFIEAINVALQVVASLSKDEYYPAYERIATLEQKLIQLMCFGDKATSLEPKDPSCDSPIMPQSPQSDDLANHNSTAFSQTTFLSEPTDDVQNNIIPCDESEIANILSPPDNSGCNSQTETVQPIGKEDDPQEMSLVPTLFLSNESLMPVDEIKTEPEVEISHRFPSTSRAFRREGGNSMKRQHDMLFTQLSIPNLVNLFSVNQNNMTLTLNPATSVAAEASTSSTIATSTGALYRRPNSCCTICGATFKYPYALETHMRRHTGEKPFRCNLCGKRFVSSSDLTVHRNMHTGKELFKCAECGKCFNQLCLLVSHERVHTGDQPYPCSVCGKRFSQLGNLTRHQRVHTGEKPYSCPVCGKRFSQASQLKYHNPVHSADRPYSCDICKIRFLKATHLHRHNLKMHSHFSYGSS